MTETERRPVSATVATRVMLGSFSAGRAEPLHELIRAARTGNRAAISEVIELVRPGAWNAWPELRSAIVVAVPGHLPGPANRLLLDIADELAIIRGWHHVHDALRRISPSPEAKAGGPRDPSAVATTIAWESAPGSEAAIILLDDVLHTGATLRSCAASIRATGDDRQLVALVLAARNG
jgi:predicted amidophosphoribosyltransferase